MKNWWYETEMKPLSFKDLINDLYCVKCNQVPKSATTVGCGHTLCRACLEECKNCPCGRYHPPVLERNFVADKLISYISKTDRNNNGTTRTSIGNNTDSIDLYSIESCIQSEAFHCSICTEMFLNPVTTPCGHTFCRWCLEMSTEVYNRCALCKCDLQMLGFVSDNTEDTLIIKAALKLGGYPSEAVPEPNDEIPIVSCTVSYPTLSCPLYIKHPRYTFAIRRSLRTGRKLFGIVHDETAECGTVMEIKDFVSLGNGRCVVTSIGIARFRIMERSVKNGCLVAKYERIFDLYTSKADIEYNLFTRVHTMTVNWFMEIPANQQDEVVREYGHWSDRDWWITGMDRQADGPSFIWWALAILPISNQLKAYVLECTSMYRRLIALDTILTIIFNPIVRSLLQPETKSP